MDLLKNWKIHLFALAITVASESIGSFKYKLLVLFPMLYAMLMGGIISWPRLNILSEKQMQYASRVLSTMMILLLVKLGLGIGPQIPHLMQAKTALLLQEVGHFLGTIMLGLPLAVMLGMGREAIGATYSVAREPNIAIISEKYGLDSPEGRGVMAMYICGTVFGSVWLAVLAGAVAQLDILHPFALAMGAGVGSGSMMAASMGSIIAVYPDLKVQIEAYAGAANIMSSVLGIWVALFLSLPVAVKTYGLLARLMGRKEEPAQPAKEA
ncbi:DUF3100 domain-containing protein [Desulfovibrio cuneatus]|uniref:DUF3100 domain-containing protein n=1 Tax=Desulfovibrio cuneatus TaxID=159728 RepID=UPI000688C253|nr:DUF3100 domain-containing protein [Desulfovibrio cuneatus]